MTAKQPTVGRFPPHVLREYSLLADGERGILVGPRGDFGWMCAPRWDSDAVFSSLIGGSGVYAITPADPRFVWGGYYEPGSLIWRSRWVTDGGIIECREALAFPGESGRAVVLRRIVAIEGAARVEVVLEARAGFGRHAMGSLSTQDGVWSVRSGPVRLRWSGAGKARVASAGHLHLTIELSEGAHHDLVLEVSDQELPAEPVQAERAWVSTEAAWARAVPEVAGTIADRDARHAHAVLRGLTSAGGGMVAAATMSLPERAERAATTTTAIPGFATSVTPDKPPPSPAPISCSTMPSASSPRASWTTARSSNLRTPWPGGRCPGSKICGFPATRAHR